MNRSSNFSFKEFMPVALIFAGIFFLVVLLGKKLAGLNVDVVVVLVGNLLLFGVTFATWVFHRSAMDSGSTQAFLRNVYGGMMLKFFVCIIAAVLYAWIAEKVNKPALFIILFLYLVYSFSELKILMNYSKRKNNA